MIRPGRTLSFVIVGLFICLVLGISLWGLGFWYFGYQGGLGHERVAGEQIYSINVENISTDIDTPDFLKPLLNAPWPMPTRENAIPRHVAPNEFYRIARRAGQAWGDLPLTRINFGSPCVHASYGPQRMSFDFIQAGGLATPTLDVFVSVDVLNSNVRVWATLKRDDILFNPPMRHKYDWSTIKVQADEALRIAEENGGRVFRESQGCEDITGFLTPSEWEIEYRTPYREPLLTFHIDWRTGAVIKKEEHLSGK